MPRYVSFDGDRHIPDLAISVTHGEVFESPVPLGPPFYEVDDKGNVKTEIKPNEIALADFKAAEPVKQSAPVVTPPAPKES
jgi:hypothetical protein